MCQLADAYFMSENLPFNTTGLHENEIQSFLETFNQLKTAFQAQPDHDFNFIFNGFDLFNEYLDVNIGFAIDVSEGKGNSHITFTQVQYQYFTGKGGRHQAAEYQSWGVAKLKKDFGHVLIKPESFLDKLQEWIQPMELDFEDDPEFSRKFYVMTDEKEKAALAMDSDFRKAILEISESDFLIEIRDSQLVIGNRKTVEPESATVFAGFLNRISAVH